MSASVLTVTILSLVFSCLFAFDTNKVCNIALVKYPEILLHFGSTAALLPDFGTASK